MPNHTTSVALDSTLFGLQAGAQVLELLDHLPVNLSTATTFLGGSDAVAEKPAIYIFPDTHKCTLLYILIRATEACVVVEVGSSFGVRTIYLALAVTRNVAEQNTSEHDASETTAANGRVLAAEADPVKAATARGYWNIAGEEIEGKIELREGDVLKTFETGLPEQVDFLFLDVGVTPPLPVLLLVRPYLKIGAMVVVDNMADPACPECQQLIVYLNNPDNGFKFTTGLRADELLIVIYAGSE